MAQENASETNREAVTGEQMAPQVAKKPTVEYGGYRRTITDVIRIRQSQEDDDPADVASLMDGLDKAIKDCRSLRVRLERIHKRRRTGYYQRTMPRGAEPEPA